MAAPGDRAGRAGRRAGAGGRPEVRTAGGARSDRARERGVPAGEGGCGGDRRARVSEAAGRRIGIGLMNGLWKPRVLGAWRVPAAGPVIM
ncbi:hypothetical protein ABT104_21645, partial [Streptomyces mobaraensis]